MNTPILIFILLLFGLLLYTAFIAWRTEIEKKFRLRQTAQNRRIKFLTDSIQQTNAKLDSLVKIDRREPLKGSFSSANPLENMEQRYVEEQKQPKPMVNGELVEIVGTQEVAPAVRREFAPKR